MYYGYIYKTTNLLNGKFYIGKHRGSEFDEKYFGSGVLIQKALRKEGKKNFLCEVLEWCETSDQLNERERYWVEELNARDLRIGYNLCAGGMGGSRFFNEDSLRRMSEARKGIPLSDEAKQKIRDTYAGMSEEDRATRSKKLHDSHVGKTLTTDQKTKIGQTLHERYASGELVSACKGKPSSNRGRKLTAEQAERRRTVCSGRIWVNNGILSKMIYPQDKEAYLNDGWNLGRLSFKKQVD